MTDSIAPIGHNKPPLTPFEIAEKEVNELYGEATLWLDGAPVNSQEIADGLANLLNMIRAAEKKADALRVEEKKPHDEAAAAVQAKFKPVLEKTKRASDACKKAIAGWLAKKETYQRAIAEQARRQAEEAQRAATAAHIAAQSAGLEAQAKAEEMMEQAAIAARIATKAEKAPTNAGGTVGRAIGIKTVYVPVMTDPSAAARHYWQTRKSEMEDFLLSLAKADVRAGKMSIPGFTIEAEKVAV